MKSIYRNKHEIIFKNEYQDFETGRLLSPVETEHYTVIQVADSYYSRQFSIPPHHQYCDLEITLPLAGGLFCANDDVWKRIERHEAYLTYCGEMHALKSARGCRFQTLAINVKEGAGKELFFAVRKRFSAKRCVISEQIATYLAAIVAEFLAAGQPFLESSLDSLITAILVTLARGAGKTRVTDVLSLQDALPAIVNYLDTHYLDICSLEELATEFDYDYNHICKIFKKRYGIAPREYLVSKKMVYAAERLCEGESVGAVAEKLGYSTPYNFSRAFKQYHKAAPTKYKSNK